MSNPEAQALLSTARERVDALLGAWSERVRTIVPGRTGEALGYALTTPGKRVRAALVMSAYQSVGGLSPAIAAVAAAVETVHTYSLVHDDLPCMDDDDLRRGRPTTHRVYDVPTATRVGFLLVPVAALVLAQAGRDLVLPAPALGRMARELFESGGIRGMVGGQWLDLEAERRGLDLDGLIAVHRGKTGALIRAACILGGVAAEAPDAAVRALADYGQEIGLAFQIADDLLDVTGTSATLGKTAGRDAAMAKSTYVSVLGVDRARSEAAALASHAVRHLEQAGLAAGSLGALAQYIVNREN
ncbi:MAG TPA: polyprenyl synthetase family protein [Gemmatimonadales bacterium]|jgi:geranylgeranyl pyrophosphate synthase|nr:polyprenyl synthetase family protein [Gemmatimonadales bacterium]